MIDPETRLDDIERAHLMQVVNTEGFNVFNRLCEYECEKFKVKLLNIDSAKADEIVAAHALAKAAAQFYAAIMNRVNAEIETYTKTPKFTDKPVDVTEGLLNIDDIALEEDYGRN